MKKKTYNVQKRRKREGKTNYKKRLKLLLSNKLRLVIRPSLKGISVQIIEYGVEGDKVMVSAHSNELKKIGWKYDLKNIPSAYLTGLLTGVKAVKKGIKNAVLDIGLQKSTKGNLVYAVVLGAIESGLEIPVKKAILPTEDRIKGKHIADYAAKMEKDKREKQFSAYIKKGLEPEKIQEHFEEVKKKILSE